jgi:hypothetical protein
MLIREVQENQANSQKLAALADFLSGRADDTSSKKQISQKAFIDLARSMGINVTEQNLADIVNHEPLQGVLEPLQPNSGVIRFRGNTEQTAGMTVDQAQNIVDQNAKAAMKRGMAAAK